MMSTTHAKYQTFAVPDDRRVLRTAARPGFVSLLVASLLVAIPLPAFAESALSKNIAIALSSNIVGSQAGQGVASAIASGAIVDFSVSVTGPTDGGSPAMAFAIIDKVPDHLSLFVGDLDRSGTGPAAFKDNDSGLDFSFEGLSSPDDSVEFSDDDGQTFGYVPIADADGFDANVTHIKLRPRGSLLATNGPYERFSLRYRMKVK